MRLQDFWTNLQVGCFNFFESLKVLLKYYSNTTFAKLDLSLLRGYLLENPYKVSKNFQQERGEETIYTYGETPLTTFERIVKKCGITQKDVFYELGCGRGRTCFWLHAFVGSRVVGVEHVPYFVEQAKRVIDTHRPEGIEFRQEDMLQTDLSDATVIYFYGTCAEEPFIRRLIERLPRGVQIMTVSFPLSDYGDHFEILDVFEERFTWGRASVYLQKKF